MQEIDIFSIALRIQQDLRIITIMESYSNDYIIATHYYILTREQVSKLSNKVHNTLRPRRS